MPRRPLRVCGFAGCGKAVDGSYCEPHAELVATLSKTAARQHDRHRGSSADRGYGADWRRLRAIVMREEPLCRECTKNGRVEPTTEVDHIVPHRGDEQLRLDRKNCQGLCTPCHSAKTARENGGFGNPSVQRNVAVSR